MNDIETLIREWDGSATIARYDHPSGAWIFIALHDHTLGRPMGGTRMKVYPQPADGLRDAQRLAEGMTHKWAAAGLEMGGGKAVLALPGPLAGAERDGLLRRYGRLLASLHGAFSTGQDLGTTPEDMAVIAGETRYVHGVRRAARSPTPARTPRAACFAAVRATLRSLLRQPRTAAGRTVLVPGRRRRRRPAGAAAGGRRGDGPGV